MSRVLQQPPFIPLVKDAVRICWGKGGPVNFLQPTAKTTMNFSLKSRIDDAGLDRWLCISNAQRNT